MCKTVLKRSRKGRYLCFAPDFREEVFSPSPLSIMLTMGFLIWPLSCRKNLLFPVYRVFSFKSRLAIEFCKTLFSASIEMIMWFFPFILLMWCFHMLVCFCMLNYPHIPGLNPTWSWCQSF